METKLFYNEESISTVFDVDETNRWKELVESLSLTGQKELLVNDKLVMPFPLMTEAEGFIMKDIFNEKVNYKEYSVEAIPLKILETIVLAEKEKYFDEIEIWYSKYYPDPYVIGRRYVDANARENKYHWSMLCYKIAAWGTKVKSVSELFPLWIKKRREDIENEYKNNLSELDSKISKFEFQINSMK